MTHHHHPIHQLDPATTFMVSILSLSHATICDDNNFFSFLTVFFTHTHAWISLTRTRGCRTFAYVFLLLVVSTPRSRFFTILYDRFFGPACIAYIHYRTHRFFYILDNSETHARMFLFCSCCAFSHVSFDRSTGFLFLSFVVAVPVVITIFFSSHLSPS